MPASLIAAMVLAASPGGHLAAKKLYESASLDYKVGNFDRALEEFTQAYALDPVASLLFNIGQCHRGLGHWRQALVSFKSYLHDRPEAANREEVEKLIAEVQEKARLADIPRPSPAPMPPPVPPPAPLAPPAFSPSTVVLVEAPAAPPPPTPPSPPPARAEAPAALPSPATSSLPQARAEVPAAPVSAPVAAVSAAPASAGHSAAAVWGLGATTLASAAAAAILDGMASAATASDQVSRVGGYTLHSVSAAQYSGAYGEGLAAEVLWGVAGALAVGTVIAIFSR